MGEKQQISFKVDSAILREFDEALNKFKEVTGIKPVRQESIEVAMSDYTKKLLKQIEILKNA